MPAETLPQIDQTLKIEPVAYVCQITGDTWKRGGFEAKMSTELVHTGKSYVDSLPQLPQGYRMAAHELMAYIAQQTEALKAEGRNPREILKNPLFARQILGNPYRREHTHMILRPPEGAEDFTKFVETDTHGRKYSRANVYHDKNLVAEGALMPHGKGVKVVEINPALGLVAIVSDDKEPNHVMHSYFEPTKNIIAVGLYGGWYDDECDRCLYFNASYGPSYVSLNYAFRLVQGSLGDIPPVSFEPFVKDRPSYDKGVTEGMRAGKQEGMRLGIEQGRSEILDTLEETLRKYRTQ